MAVALVAGVLLLAACSGSESNTSNDTTTATTAVPLADQAAYAQPGPYVAGATTLELDGRTVEVWYPAEPGAEVGVEPVVFEIRDLLPDNLKEIVPDDLNPKYVTNAYPGIEASTQGPFPVVLFAHGFAAYPTEYQYLLTHLASWGFVVAGPDYDERGLLAAFAGSTERADETAVMLASRDLLGTENTRPGSPLEGIVDITRVGTGGHSAGVSPAVGAAVADPTIKTFVAMSGGRPQGGETTLPTPTQPGMVVTGGKDEIASFANVRGFFDSLDPVKRLVVVDEAGHNAFNDLCVMGEDQGGLLTIATEVGITPTEQITRLFNDGCAPEFLPARQAWPPTQHFVTAQFRYYLGLDDEPVGLGPAVVRQFAPIEITYEIVE